MLFFIALFLLFFWRRFLKHFACSFLSYRLRQIQRLFPPFFCCCLTNSQGLFLFACFFCLGRSTGPLLRSCDDVLNPSLQSCPFLFISRNLSRLFLLELQDRSFSSKAPPSLFRSRKYTVLYPLSPIKAIGIALTRSTHFFPPPSFNLLATD